MTETSNRTRVSAGVPTGGEFATEAKAENPDLVIPAPRVKPEPMKAVAIHATERNRTIDITTAMANLDAADHAVLLRIAQKRHAAYGDSDWQPTTALQDMVRKTGELPEGFSLRVTPSEVIWWLKEYPAWSDNGHEQHLTGGYVKHLSGPDFDFYLDENDEPHREDGPATVMVFPEDYVETVWAIHGKRDRKDGLPAVTRSNGEREWWEDGRMLASFTAEEEGVDLSKLKMGPE